MTTKKLVIIGGGAAGVLIAMKLSKIMKQLQLDITLIDCKTFYEYTPALCSVVFAKTEQDCRSHFSKITAEYLDLLPNYGVRFVLGKVADIQQDNNKVLLSSGETLDYDYIVITTGSTYADPWKASTNDRDHFIDLKERLEYILQQRSHYQSATSILCIGGGPVGVETAAEIAFNAPEKRVTLVDMNDVVLSNAPNHLGRHAQRILTTGLSVRVINGEKAEYKQDIEHNQKLYETDKSHTQIKTDLVYNCIGAKPNSTFLQETKNKSWLNQKKEIDVDDTLLVKGTDGIFAIGDVCSFDEPKMFFTAHMQAVHFVKNLTGLLRGKHRLEPYKGSMMAMVISLGPERAVAYVGGITLSGFNSNKGSRTASLMKYMIERITMNDFHSKLIVNEILYLTHEKGHAVPRVINKLIG